MKALLLMSMISQDASQRFYIAYLSFRLRQSRAVRGLLVKRHLEPRAWGFERDPSDSVSDLLSCQILL